MSEIEADKQLPELQRLISNHVEDALTQRIAAARCTALSRKPAELSIPCVPQVGCTWAHLVTVAGCMLDAHVQFAGHISQMQPSNTHWICPENHPAVFYLRETRARSHQI